MPDGDRSHVPRRPVVGCYSEVFQDLDNEKRGIGPGPSRLECLLYAGHTGVSTEGEATVYGLNPDGGADPVWRVLENLRNGDAYPGVVRDDSNVFQEARQRGLTVTTARILLPDSGFRAFRRRLSAERRRSRFTYGFPDGDGDCNCTTWLERLALPLLTGSMEEFTVLGFGAYPSRRFGRCI